MVITALYHGDLGTRMWRRGANLEGDVANFIETEQLVEINGLRSSFMQVFLVYLMIHQKNNCVHCLLLHSFSA